MTARNELLGCEEHLSRIVAQSFAGEGGGGGAVVAGRHSFTYDAAGRLASYTDGSGTKQVGFDANGIRTQFGSQSFAFNANDSMASAPGAPVFDYHPFGGLKSDGCRTYAFDGFDRMESTTAAGGAGCGTVTATSYGYDGLDRQRTRTEGAAAAEVFQFDGLSTQPAAEVEDGRFVHYLLGPAGAPEGVRTSGSSMVSQLLVDDGFGSVATAIDRTSGAVACTARFDAYGSPLSAQSESNVCVSGSTPNEVFFAGGRRDPATGQYQFGSRTYDPTKATFLTPDTYRNQQPTADLSVGTDPLTRNRYGYVNGDPVNLFDPTGHEPCPKSGCTYADRGAAPQRQRRAELRQAQNRVAAARTASYSPPATTPGTRAEYQRMVAANPSMFGEGTSLWQFLEFVGEVLVEDYKKCWDNPSISQACFWTVLDAAAIAGTGGAWAAARGGRAEAGAARATRALSPIDEAIAGGKHSGFLKGYARRSPAEIQRGIRSIERQIDKHLTWIEDPYRKIPDWNKMDPRQRQALITKKWPGDIQRQREQVEILRHLLERGGS